MKTCLLLSTALLLAGTALADVNYNIAIGQAKRAANGESNPQPPQQPPAAAPQAPPTNPELAATMKNIADLRMDIASLVKASDATDAADQRLSLLNHLSAAAQGSKKASTASVKKLAEDLMAAINGKKIPADQQAVLARNLHALFNGSHLSATVQQTLLDGVKKILTTTGVAGDQADNLMEDLKAVAAETK